VVRAEALVLQLVILLALVALAVRSRLSQEAGWLAAVCCHYVLVPGLVVPEGQSASQAELASQAVIFL